MSLLRTFVSFFMVVLAANFVNSTPEHISKFDYNEGWESYKKSLSLEFDSKDEVSRFEIYKNNMRHILETNSQNGPFQLKMNSFGHLRDDEIPTCLKMKKTSKNSKGDGIRKIDGDEVKIPKAVDWRDNGVVAPVKNQGKCGSCYSFSAISAIESMVALSYGKLMTLSEQEPVDCSKRYGNEGCNGGLMENVFEYVRENGISAEKDYPYVGHEEECLRNTSNSRFNISKFVELDSGSESELQLAIAFKGPTSVAIDASAINFRFYHRGVYLDSNCGKEDKELNHGVLAVGYGTADMDYYIVRNSWGPDWGNDGYILMARNKDNNCGIATAASYPVQ